jgi:mannose-6-phosphate isomerase-like protein (cupin superfamily)
LITGVDAQGNSCVVEEKDVGTFGDAVKTSVVFETTEVVPGPRPIGRARISISASRRASPAGWWCTGRRTARHTSTTPDTVDYDAILQGSTTLILDDGEHLLERGDCVVITGVHHDWRTGPEGCIQSVVLLGSTLPA